MTDEFDSTPKKKLLEKRSGGSLAIPVAIVLVGALIIFGVSKMLSHGKDYRDLVREMQSKTLGNRWVAAFELSKLVAGQALAPEEIPWLVENLSALYKEKEKTGHRTRNFIIMTFGALKHPDVLPLLEHALDDPDSTVVFNAIVAIGNLPEGMSIHWPKLMDKLSSEDEGIRHAAIFALASKRVDAARPLIVSRLKDPALAVKYAAAVALVRFRSEKALPVIREILLSETHQRFDERKWQKIRLNLISAIGREKWRTLKSDLESVVASTKDLRIQTTAKEALNLLKI